MTDPVSTAEKLIEKDPWIAPYRDALIRRHEWIERVRQRLVGEKGSLADFASGHEYFGLHFRDGEWVFREWAPNAERICLIGQMTDWQEKEPFALERIDDQEGVWEVRLPADALSHNDLYRLRLHWPGGGGDRIPAYARRVVQDTHTKIFNAQVWAPEHPYEWRFSSGIERDEPALVYECHVGMATEDQKVGTYREFTENILPRIADAGYNTIQLMAIQEHPYYGSFGYQVSNFFAASSRYGTPDEFKELIDRAHELGLRVVMDIVHSHAVANEVEGLSRFDGTEYQYFHKGGRGYHTAWSSRLFDYAKPQSLHFLLSNCRFWLDEYRIDGFRFDGVTSMLYHDHGLGKAFSSYDDYFGGNVDEDALVYLALANRLIHTVRPDAVTIAEDISGMPGLALPVSKGGIGFDYRFSMGVPDLWIKLTEKIEDEYWPMSQLWFELNNRRAEEKSISYVESHDQALVGDKTLIFRLMDKEMYHHMHVDDGNLIADRGIALHKMIRLITLTTAGNGYLNFMGNEFGHPEWIDFPREGNNWSHYYARRQWSLADHPELKYRFLKDFDRAMINLAREYQILKGPLERLLHEHSDDKVIAFFRGGLVFVFNFHPTKSYTDYGFEAPPGEYRILLDSDDAAFGGHDRIDRNISHSARPDPEDPRPAMLRLYLPSRTALVLEPI